MTANEYRTTIGTVTDGGKIHLAHGSTEQRTLCRFGGARKTTTTTVAEVLDTPDLCDTLVAAEVPIDKLCRQCFCPDMRVRYQARLNAVPATHE